jgi:hypothetical protein
LVSFFVESGWHTSKIRGISLERLHFYHDYFSEARLEVRDFGSKYIEAAARRLDLLEKEISRRHGDLRDRKTRKLAWIAIFVSALSALGTVGQWLANRQFAMPNGASADSGNPSALVQ